MYGTVQNTRYKNHEKPSKFGMTSEVPVWDNERSKMFTSFTSSLSNLLKGFR